MTLHYDPASGVYTSIIPSGSHAFAVVVSEHFGFRVEIVRDHSRCNAQKSEHCECRGEDFFVAAPKGRPLFDWAVAHADELGIQSVIHDRRVWGFGHWTERHYEGPNAHIDHVHIGLTIAASKTLTAAKVRAALEADDMTEDQAQKLEFVYQAVKRDGPDGKPEGIDKWLDRKVKEIEATLAKIEAAVGH